MIWSIASNAAERSRTQIHDILRAYAVEEVVVVLELVDTEELPRYNGAHGQHGSADLL